MDLHVPVGKKAVSDIITYVTDTLDAVVIGRKRSAIYTGSVHLILAGNDRDLAIAAERASKLGGVVD